VLITGDISSVAQFQPALGPGWQHNVNVRIVLARDELDGRVAIIGKSLRCLHCHACQPQCHQVFREEPLASSCLCTIYYHWGWIALNWVDCRERDVEDRITSARLLLRYKTSAFGRALGIIRDGACARVHVQVPTRMMLTSTIHRSTHLD
jgi:hypothetical protein